MKAVLDYYSSHLHQLVRRDNQGISESGSQIHCIEYIHAAARGTDRKVVSSVVINVFDMRSCLLVY